MANCKRRIILDVDTGTDDATAIILAALSEEIELAGLTVTWGNHPLEETVRHTLMITELLGREIPVYAGCPRPLVRDLYRQAHEEHARTAVDENGNRFGYHDAFQLPEPKVCCREKHAVQFIIDECLAAEQKLTLVGVGPLTNIAMALRIDPRIVENIEEIVVMGGGIRESNSTLCAEGNIFRDPEAAEIVLHSGVKVTFIPLDATHRAALPSEYVGMCRDVGSPIGDFFAEMLQQRIRAYNAMQPLWRLDIAPIHDALCIAYLIDPAVIADMRQVHLRVCLDRGEGAGAFLIDNRHFHRLENARVAYDADSGRFGEIVMGLLNKTRNS